MSSVDPVVGTAGQNVAGQNTVATLDQIQSVQPSDSTALTGRDTRPRCCYLAGMRPSLASTGTSTDTVSGYFTPVPVLRTTTSSSSLSHPASRNCAAAAKQAAPSGQMKGPSAVASSTWAASSSSSVTAIAVPSVS